MRRFARHRLLALFTSLALGALVVGGLAVADTTTKTFTLTVSSEQVAWAGSTPTVVLTLTNNAASQQLGSANIAVPDGIVPDPPLPTGNIIQLRDLALAPGASVDYRLPVRMPCIPDPAGYPWVGEVKQSNDFNGTGNDFLPTGPAPRLLGSGLCSLAFLPDGQPASAQRGTAITADPYLPDSTRAVSVRVADGSGAGTVAWWPSSPGITLAISPDHNPGATALAGATQAGIVDGIARFLTGGSGPTIPVSASGYRLTATTPGVTGAQPLSDAFDISDDAARCSSEQAEPCVVQSSNDRFQAEVTTTAITETDLLFASLGAPGPTLDCAGYAETTDPLLFDVTTPAGLPSGSDKTVVYTILNPVKSASKYDICFRAPYSFRTKALGFAPLQPDGQFLGLLPDCRRVSGQPPCIASRARSAGTVVLTVTAPPLDPMMRG